MNDKIHRVRYLNLKQHIDGLHLAKLIDDAEALHILARLKRQFEPSVYEETDPKKEKNDGFQTSATRYG